MKKLILALLLSFSCSYATFVFANDSDVKVVGNNPENEFEQNENPDQEIIYLDGYPHYRHKPMPYSG
ncbi:hypothetical protein [Chlamydia sp. 04-14]|uniref:hypothetical protein n=1 Tax=Chlamydia TaxID=810 RepID=UPI002FCA2A96